jgi:hypothetical protein
MTAAERAVATEAVTCAATGNTVFTAANTVRAPVEIARIIERVAVELDAEIDITIVPNGVQVTRPRTS